MIKKFYDSFYGGNYSSGDYVTTTENKTEKTVIECECGTHMLKVESDTDIYTTQDNSTRINQSYYLAMFSYGNPSKRNFLERLKIAFDYLKTGKMFSDQLCLNPEEALKLSDFIKSTIVETKPTNNETK